MGNLDAVQRYFDGWSRRDADAVLASLTPDGTYEDPTTGGPVTGEDFRATMTRLWSAFPDLAFRIESVAESGPDRAAAEWVMIGTNTGGMMGLPPTGRAVRLRGADFFSLDGDRIASVTGYFDSAGVPRQLGLDVIVQPAAIGPFRFGVATMVRTGKTQVPGAFSITYLEAIDAAARQKVREDSRASLIDMLDLDGFIGATTATVGNSMVTISAWDSPEESRRVMKEGAHAAVMHGMINGSLATGGFTSVWTPYRINPGYLRCDACGKMTRDAQAGQSCRCGAPLPEPLPYW